MTTLSLLHFPCTSDCSCESWSQTPEAQYTATSFSDLCQIWQLHLGLRQKITESAETKKPEKAGDSAPDLSRPKSWMLKKLKNEDFSSNQSKAIYASQNCKVGLLYLKLRLHSFDTDSPHAINVSCGNGYGLKNIHCKRVQHMHRTIYFSVCDGDMRQLFCVNALFNVNILIQGCIHFMSKIF